MANWKDSLAVFTPVERGPYSNFGDYVAINAMKLWDVCRAEYDVCVLEPQYDPAKGRVYFGDKSHNIQDVLEILSAIGLVTA